MYANVEAKKAAVGEVLRLLYQLQSYTLFSAGGRPERAGRQRGAPPACGGRRAKNASLDLRNFLPQLGII